jgi:hypothetical protein
MDSMPREGRKPVAAIVRSGASLFCMSAGGAKLQKLAGFSVFSIADLLQSRDLFKQAGKSHGISEDCRA